MGNNLELFLEVVPALAVILVAARITGSLALLVGQPRVVGEMVAGILLGPSLFGMIAPDLQAMIFTTEVKSVLFVLCNLGLTLYMFLVGAEMEHGQLSGPNLGKASMLAAAGIVPAFALGAAVGLGLYEQISLPTITELNFAIFMGCALSITAFPMLARILQERGLTNSPIGSLTLVAASVDDAAAWSMLALVTAMAQAKSMMAGMYTAIGGVIFAVFMFTLGKKWLAKLGERAEKEGTLSQASLAIILLVLLGSAWFTDYIGIFSVFGGFITGLAMPKTPVFTRELKARMFDFVVVFLLPIFFAYSGLNTNLQGISSVALLGPLAIIVIASIIGKYAGCLFSMKAMGFSWRESSAIGGLMNARGLMELAIVNIGMAYGVISQDLFTMLVVMAVITTAMAMPIYTRSLPPDLEGQLNSGGLQRGVSKQVGV